MVERRLDAHTVFPNVISRPAFIHLTRAAPMPLTYVEGDPLLTRMQTLAFGTNAQGRAEVTPLAEELHRRYPAAFATYRKQARSGRVQPGELWVWRESVPRLAFMVVRASAVGATRPRYVDAAALRLVRDHLLEGITSVAIAPLGRDEEQPSIREALDLLLPLAALPVVAYTRYVPGVTAEEPS